MKRRKGRWNHDDSFISIFQPPQSFQFTLSMTKYNKVAFGYLNFKVMDLKCLNSKSKIFKYVIWISNILWIKKLFHIQNSKILRFKIPSGFVRSKSLTLCKLSKQSI